LTLAILGYFGCCARRNILLKIGEAASILLQVTVFLTNVNNPACCIFKVSFRPVNKKSRIHGIGTYANEYIPAKRKIGSLSGEVISKREATSRSRLSASIAIVELWNGKALMPALTALGYIIHLIPLI